MLESLGSVGYGAWMLATRDLPNLAKYGRNGPLWVERIWLDPRRLSRVIHGWRDKHSAMVIGGDWPYLSTTVLEQPKIVACRAHWEDGLAWEDTGIYEYMTGEMACRGGQFDGCRTLDDVVRRYRRVDTMFYQMRADRRLRTRQELSRLAFRERGGIRVHIGRELEPIWSGSGGHRLAASLVLRFETIPAYVGVVHPDGIRRWREVYAAN